MKNQKLVDYLKKCGVCSVCQLRYLKARGTEYKDIKSSFEKLHVEYKDNAEQEDENNQQNKKQRMDICPTCLGLFSKEFQTELISGILSSEMKTFDCDSIVLAITMPILLQIRQLSMWLALLREFDTDIDRNRAPDVPLKEAVKLILNPTICEKLGKTYDANGNGMMINITLQHSQEETELACIQKLNSIAFPSTRKKRNEISRGMLEKQYTPQHISAELFSEYLPIPPTIPDEGLRLAVVSVTGPTAFVAGRYRKLSRELSHTPWVLNGQRVMEDSIEEIIIRNVVPNFCKMPQKGKVIFMSSGREDVDVRCLGKGRPFVLEIPNATSMRLPSEVACDMQRKIDDSQKVSVRDLQMVQREELVHIKMGEEKKRKFYRALCGLNEPATPDMLQKLQLPTGFEIQQKTPIRVLHRRPLHTRPRTIYSLKAYVQRDNPRILVLDVISQAGTYIKELVHGEFGRTTPSVASIIGQPIDIIALDVVGIDLDWPPQVDNSI